MKSTKSFKPGLGLVWIMVTLLAMACRLGGAVQADPTAIPTEAASATPAPTATPEPTATPSPTETPLPTDTPVPTATATPDLKATAAVEATQTAQAALELVQKDLELLGYSTDTGSLGWLQSDPERIRLTGYNQRNYTPFADELEASDFVLKTDITWESTGGLALCGFMFRAEPDFERGGQYIMKTLRLSGLPAWAIMYAEFGLIKRNISDVLTAEAIDQDNGGTNTYLLAVEGEKFVLYINGTRIGQFFDYGKNRTEGLFAFFGQQESGETTCTFSNSWVWLLK